MNVAVLGAGSTGRDIATVCARAGNTVRLQSDDATRAMDSIDNVEHRIVKAHEGREISDETRRAAIDGLEATTNLSAVVSDADIVIETTTETGEELQERFAEVEGYVDRETLITTTSTGVSVTAAAAGLRHPDRALGLNVFEPPTTPVIELILADQTTADAVDRTRQFLKGLETTAVLVRDGPGIASQRLALALEVEAMRAVDDDVVSVEGVDHLLQKGLNFPVGPLERADRAGLDDRLETLEALSDALGDRFAPPAVLRERVESGNTGMDAGEGFYVWDSGEPVEPALAELEIPERDDQSDDPAHR